MKSYFPIFIQFENSTRTLLIKTPEDIPSDKWFKVLKVRVGTDEEKEIETRNTKAPVADMLGK